MPQITNKQSVKNAYEKRLGNAWDTILPEWQTRLIDSVSGGNGSLYGMGNVQNTPPLPQARGQVCPTCGKPL
jgi:hypothetical protein